MEKGGPRAKGGGTGCDPPWELVGAFRDTGPEHGGGHSPMLLHRAALDSAEGRWWVGSLRSVSVLISQACLFCLFSVSASPLAVSP